MGAHLPAQLQQGLRWAFYGCLLAVLVLTLMPVAIPNQFPNEDKWHHVLAFLALATLAGLAWSPPWWKLVPALSALGALIEVLQHFIPNRSMDVHDWQADTVGVIIGCFLCPLLLFIYRRWPRRNS